MSNEKIIQNDIPDNLSVEQQEQKIDELSSATNLIQKKKPEILWKFNQKIMREFGKEFDLDNYILGRKLIGTSTDKDENLPFDIQDKSDPTGLGLIEKFIRENL